MTFILSELLENLSYLASWYWHSAFIESSSMIEIDKNKQMHPTNLNQLSCLQGRVGELREQFIRFWFFLIGINFIQGRTASTRHGVARKRNIKRLQHTENLFRKNLQLKMSVNSRLVVTKNISQRKAFYPENSRV